MTRAFNIITVFLFISILFISCEKKEKYASLKIKEKTINFGTITKNDTIDRVFEIENISDVPLKIYKLGTSCGCTGAIISDSIINKNETGKIHVQFIPKEGEFGDVRSAIVIETNTEKAYNSLYLEGYVKEENKL